MSKVSIIIPMFNSEEFLDECLNSIRNQSYKNIEVLMMNDGSKDNTKEIAQKFADTDKRFKYFEHPNMGQGLSRNRGIELSTGDYLLFVDADDYIHTDSVKLLLERIYETSTDVACGEMVRLQVDGTQKLYRSFDAIQDKVVTNINSEEFYREFIFTGDYSPHPVAKLFRASLIKKNNIVFADNKRVHAEDRYFQILSLLHIESISFIAEPVYYYIERPGSHSQTAQLNTLEKQLQMVKDYDEHVHSDLHSKVSSLMLFSGVLGQISNIVNAGSDYSTFKNIMENLRQDPYFKNKMLDLYNYKSYQLHSNKKLRYFVLAVSILEKLKLDKLSNRFIYLVQKTRIQAQ